MENDIEDLEAEVLGLLYPRSAITKKNLYIKNTKIARIQTAKD